MQKMGLLNLVGNSVMLLTMGCHPQKLIPQLILVCIVPWVLFVFFPKESNTATPLELIQIFTMVMRPKIYRLILIVISVCFPR